MRDGELSHGVAGLRFGDITCDFKRAVFSGAVCFRPVLVTFAPM